MKKNNYLSFLIILILSLSLSAFAENKDNTGKHKKPPLQKTVLDPAQSLIDINQITCWVGSDGYHDWIVGGSWNGAYPNGVPFGPIFSEGIIWGGIVNDGTSPAVRVNGNTYGSGCSPVTRLYRVRSDYVNGDLAQDAADFFDKDVNAVSQSDIDELRAQYAKDWNEWPARAEAPEGDQGAPYQDVDSNGVYDPAVDIPGIPGASQTLFIKYNDDQTPLYGSPAIGLEVSETYWAYAVAGALGNVIFKKVDIYYKGTSTTPASATIDSMYIVQWSDPDVGNSGDDFAGCDTTLNLGYAYNSSNNDATYATRNLPPPAAGYDFLQGVSQYTGDPNDSAIFNLKWRHGYAYVNPKPMSSFAYFAAGGTWSDPAFTYTGTLEFYNLMRGFLPDPPYPEASAFPSSVADVTPYGTYLVPGDPVFSTGKLDGSVDAPGDRRIMVTNGPITMSYHDTAQIVLALVGGLGQNNLSSISVMKYNDAFAQYAYDQLFDIPIMPKPSVKGIGLDDKIVLNWSVSDSITNVIENQPHGPYTFEAYSVYQLPPGGTDITAGVRIATFDVVNSVQVLFDKVLDENTGLIYSRPIVFLNNTNGIQRYLSIDQDQIFGKPLANGLSYTFAVTAIAYSNDPSLPTNILESSPTIVNVTPQKPGPGTRYSSTAGDTLAVNHSGGSDGSVIPIVIDPTVVTGDVYQVIFDTTGGQTTWALKDSTKDMVLLSGQTNQTGDELYSIVDGMMVKVTGPPPGVKPGDDGWDIPEGTRRFTWSGADFGWESFSGALGYGSPYGVFGPGPEPISPNDLNSVLLKLATVTDADSLFDPAFNANDENMSYGYRYGRGFSNAPVQARFAPHIINAVGGYSFQDFTKNMPMSAWNVDDPASPQRIVLGWLENNAPNGLVDGKYWPSDASLDNIDGDGPREWLFIYQSTYSETADPGLELELTGNPLPIMFWATWNRRGAVPFSPGASGEDQFQIFPTRPNSLSDVFSFTAPSKTTSGSLAKDDVQKVNVFPNPYYGYQYRENAREQHYVTFSHLPQMATIRIFDLSGVLVRTINHSSTDVNSQFERWNLQNDSGYPVASGIYVVYIDMPGVGATKILKLAVIQEQQILRVY